MRKAVVTGMIASYPVGGVAWDYAQYALGLAAMGFEVMYLEDTGCQTFHPETGEDAVDFSVEFLHQSLAALSPTLGQRWHFRALDGRVFGLDFRDLGIGAVNSGSDRKEDVMLLDPTRIIINS